MWIRGSKIYLTSWKIDTVHGIYTKTQDGSCQSMVKSLPNLTPSLQYQLDKRIPFIQFRTKFGLNLPFERRNDPVIFFYVSQNPRCHILSSINDCLQ